MLFCIGVFQVLVLFFNLKLSRNSFTLGLVTFLNLEYRADQFSVLIVFCLLRASAGFILD